MQDEKAKRVAKALLKAYPEHEQPILFNWARAILAIRHNDLPAHKKLLQIGRVTKDMDVTAPFIKHFGSEIKRVGWDERTRTMRGVIGGAGVGLLASVAGPMAGVAAFGGAIAVPVIFLSAGAGAVLTAIVEDFGRDK